MAAETPAGRIVDLTLPVPKYENGRATVTPDPWPIKGPGFEYTGMVYHFTHWSMSGTYIDFPGHIHELDDGATAEIYAVEKLFRIPAVVIHLDRGDRPGKVSADELQAACPARPDGGALIVHALGPRQFDEVAERSVAFSKDAIDWIARTGVHLLVSDIYEHADEPENVFWRLFEAGISTVCCPINLDRLSAPAVKLTVLFARVPGVTQMPCRVVAEM